MQMPYQRCQKSFARKTHLYLRPSESIEPFVSVSNERQTHLCAQIVTLSRRLRSQCGTHIRLWNLIDREVLRVNIALELGLKWCADTTKTIPLDTAEEGVLANLGSSPKSTETVVGIADEAVRMLAE
jgi:hypothetical protein